MITASDGEIACEKFFSDDFNLVLLDLMDENAVNVHISRLRTKIEDDPRNPRYITQTSHIKNGIRTLKNQYFNL